MRIFGLTSSQADHFNADKTKHNHLQRHEKTANAFREKAAIVNKIVKTGMTKWRFKANNYHEDAQNNESNDGHNFNQGKPEFGFSEQSDTDQIQQQQDR